MLSGGLIPLTLDVESDVLLEVEYTDLGLSEGVNLCNGRSYHLIIIRDNYSRWLSLDFVFNGVYGFH